MSELRVVRCTDWRDVGISKSKSKVGAVRALAVALLATILVTAFPLSLTAFLAILIGTGALASLLFESARLLSRKRYLQRVEFDDRELRIVEREEPKGTERVRRVPYGALEYLNVDRECLAVIGFKFRIEEYLEPKQFSSYRMIEDFLERVRAQGVTVTIKDDSMRLARYWSAESAEQGMTALGHSRGRSD